MTNDAWSDPPWGHLVEGNQKRRRRDGRSSSDSRSITPALPLQRSRMIGTKMDVYAAEKDDHWLQKRIRNRIKYHHYSWLRFESITSCQSDPLLATSSSIL